MSDTFLKEYYSRLAKESLLKSLLYGLIVGFSALFLTATGIWIAGAKQFWISFIVFAAAFGGAVPIFYFKKFKPTAEQIAFRMDRLGLEERMITMNELKNDNSYIARRQREDAQEKMRTVRATQLKLVVPKLPIALSIVAAIVGGGMCAVAALSGQGVINSGAEIIDDIFSEPPMEYEVEYLESEGGMVEGEELFQLVKEGDDALPVLAVPLENYMFVGWSDGFSDPYREDLNVQGDISVTAMFMMAGSGGGEGGDGSGDGDSDQKKPPKEGENGDQGGEDGSDSSDSETTSGGGKYDPVNQVIDGSIYFGSVYDDAYEEVLKALMEDEDMPQYLKDMILKYFNTIRN